jgi:hypothetical protein
MCLPCGEIMEFLYGKYEAFLELSQAAQHPLNNVTKCFT